VLSLPFKKNKSIKKMIQLQTSISTLIIAVLAMMMSNVLLAQTSDRQAAMESRVKSHATERTQHMKELYKLDDRQTKSIQRLNENHQRKIFEGTLEQQALMTKLRGASDEERSAIQTELTESRRAAAEQRQKHERDYMRSLRRILNDAQNEQLVTRQKYNLDIYKASDDDDKKIAAYKEQVKAEELARERKEEARAREAKEAAQEAELLRKRIEQDQRKREGGQ